MKYLGLPFCSGYDSVLNQTSLGAIHEVLFWFSYLSERTLGSARKAKHCTKGHFHFRKMWRDVSPPLSNSWSFVCVTVCDKLSWPLVRSSINEALVWDTSVEEPNHIFLISCTGLDDQAFCQKMCQSLVL